jgi:ferritin
MEAEHSIWADAMTSYWEDEDTSVGAHDVQAPESQLSTAQSSILETATSHEQIVRIREHTPDTDRLHILSQLPLD